MSVPFFTIMADGKDVTGNLTAAGLITMTIVDGEGLRSDTLQIEIDDIEGQVVAPRKGAVLQAIAGYEDSLRDFGLFTVDNVVYSGWPQKISIDAKSVAAKSLSKQRDPKAYRKEQFPTYGDIFADVSGRIGLSLQMAPEIRSQANPYEAQSDEDALEFLTRLASKLNATVSVKAGNLVVVVKGAGESASGGALDRIIVAPTVNLLSYSVTAGDEPKHSEVEASYYDRQINAYEKVAATTGLDGPTFRMRRPFQDRQEAQRAASSRAKELQRMQGEASFVIEGDPFAQAGAWVQASGCRTEVDGLWRVTTVTHQFSSEGAYTTSLACGTTSPER